MRDFRVAVIGAGASGTLFAAHWNSDEPIALVEAGARAARGLAYGTPYGAHLLNVPAARMSGLSHDPDHFLRWLKTELPGAHAGTFAPRTLYGEYLAQLLGERHSVVRVGGTAVGLTRDGDFWTIHLHDSRTIHARAVVLALGNLPPADPLRATNCAPPKYLRDPWTPGAALGLDANAPVLLIGTGLTMIDLVLSLRAEGHRGPLHALSRHGRLPQRHAHVEPRTLTLPDDIDSPLGALRWIRRELEQAADWRQVIDAMRPHTSSLWQRFTIAQRASFLRHLRNLWDVHRHRMAPQVASQIDELLASGTLTIHRGQLTELHDDDGGVRAAWSRGALHVARVINCTGPACDYARVDLPLVVQLRQAGWLVPDPLGLGVETGADGALLGANGAPVPGLFTMGPLRRPALWESTAIPEIRAQAAMLAARLKDGAR
jgi:uncharacterized NAD(P)/FAD-binding protein YdhS